MNRVEREGIGIRYERQLTRNLYAQFGYSTNRTLNRTPLAPFDNGTAPYHSPNLAGVALNYVDATGTKAGIQVNYRGRFPQDTGALSATTRPMFASRAYVDLVLAKEPTVHREYFLKISNLFNTRAIEFNDYPTNQRRVEVGVTERF